MNALTQQNLEILEYYATKGNRVLYFNYRASLEGVDNYPAMGLGVVNNDSMAGQIANRHAADFVARQQSEHGSRPPSTRRMRSTPRPGPAWSSSMHRPAALTMCAAKT